MKRIAAVVGAAALVFSASSASAQKGTLFVVATGGATIPIGDFKDSGAKTGWMANGGLGYDITNNLFLAAVYRYGSNSNDAGGDALKLSGFEGSVGYSFGAEGAKMHPYLRAGIGQLKGKVGDISGDGQTTYSGAFGLYMPKSAKWGWFVEGQYNTISAPEGGTSSNFIGVHLGFTWALMTKK
ncbi:MAG TPA: outer membrane beta-barrel protein [Gemmatimonadaceae bacterium]|nr:outer membrane beta-barrel protein [Gemmatimonadaceae bacterium]